jgi:hypothetical protein
VMFVAFICTTMVRQKEYDFRRTVLTAVHSRGAF